MERVHWPHNVCHPTIPRSYLYHRKERQAAARRPPPQSPSSSVREAPLLLAMHHARDTSDTSYTSNTHETPKAAKERMQVRVSAEEHHSHDRIECGDEQQHEKRGAHLLSRHRS